MPRPHFLPVDEREVADPAGFDLSDLDEVDIGRAEPAISEVRHSHWPARVDRPDDVLAVCALLVFQGRRRKAPLINGHRALPGL